MRGCKPNLIAVTQFFVGGLRLG